MSSMVRFTPLHEIDDDEVSTSRNSYGAGVKILDREGLVDALPDTLVDQMDTRSYTDHSEYPRQEWDLLLGFTTFGRNVDEGPDADYHNVSNTDPRDFSDTFATVSEYTEDFVVWITDFDGYWPHAAEIAAGRRCESIFELTATDGAVSMEEIRFDVTEREEVDLS